jgi:hypothetical protein
MAKLQARHFVPGYYRAVPPGQGIQTAIKLTLIGRNPGLWSPFWGSAALRILTRMTRSPKSERVPWPHGLNFLIMALT